MRTWVHQASSSVLALVLVGSALLCVPGGVSAQGFKWWNDETVQRRLGLSPDQSRRIDEVFQAALPELQRGKQQLDAAEQELARLADTADNDAIIAPHVDRVESARATLNRTRTLMLLRMRRVLTAEQRLQLNDVYKARRHMSNGARP